MADNRLYNSRITSERLEKQFRDTFTAQGGAELVDDLYASGVIVPVVDFSAAAAGTNIADEFAEAWDFATTALTVTNTTSTIISTPGFWKVDLNCTMGDLSFGTGTRTGARVSINNGIATKDVWRMPQAQIGGTSTETAVISETFVVFLRSGHSLEAFTADLNIAISVWWRQIADVNGDRTFPQGFNPS